MNTKNLEAVYRERGYTAGSKGADARPPTDDVKHRGAYMAGYRRGRERLEQDARGG